MKLLEILVENNGHWIEFGDQVMNSSGEQILQQLVNLLNANGMKSDVDYRFAVAMGDDRPHGIEIMNPSILQLPNFRALVDQIEGPSPYGEDY